MKLRTITLELVALAGCVPEIAPAPADALPPHTAEAPPPAPEPAIAVLWREPLRFSDQALLLGVDRRARRAYLRIETKSPESWQLVTVDLASGRRLDTWTATDAKPLVHDGDRFHPPSGDAAADRRRLAEMMIASGPWHTRAWEHWPIDGAVPGATVWTEAPRDGKDGDWLWLAQGDSVARVGVGLTASYHARFSPDGSRIAWTGCVRAPCGYDLHFARLADAASGRYQSAGVPEGSGPLWSADGRTIFTEGLKSRTLGAERCIYRVDADTARASEVLCARDLQALDLDDAGSRGLVTLEDGDPGRQVQTFIALDLARGTLGARHTVDRASGDAHVHGDLVLAAHQDGLAVIDLAADRHAIVPHAEGYFSLLQVAWDGDRALLLRTLPDDTVELVRLDPRRILAQRRDSAPQFAGK